MRVALNYKLFNTSKAETTALIAELNKFCRDVYFVDSLENVSKRAKALKALHRTGACISDIVYCSADDLDFVLKKHHVDLYFSDENLKASEILRLTKDRTEQDKEKAISRKQQIEQDISAGKRGETPSQQMPWHKFLPDEKIQFEFPQMSMYDYLYAVNKATEYKNALRYFGKHITFKQLFENIELCAKAFLANHVKAGDVVMLAVPNIPESVYMIYALGKIGATADIVDPRHAPSNINGAIRDSKANIFVLVDANGSLEHLNEYITDTTVKTVITVSPADSLSPVLKILYNATNKSTPPNVSGIQHFNYKTFLESGKSWHKATRAEYQKGSIAAIVYTSGTTGKPKGIMLTHDAINASACICEPFIEDMQPEDTFLGMMPVFMSFGVVNGMHYPLIIGQELILVPQWSEDEFPVLLQKHKPNHVSSVPKCWSLVADSIQSGKYTDFSFLKTPMCGADALPEATHKRINTQLSVAGCRYPLSNGYGASQVCAGIAAPTYDRESTDFASVGIPIGNVVVSVMDLEQNKECPYNTDGEIWICSPTVMQGYLDEQEKDIEFSEYNGRRWWHSSDIGHMDENGRLFIVGRMKDAIATKSGTKISPSYISEAILKIGEYRGKKFDQEEIRTLSAAIQECVVVGVECNDQNLSYQVPVAHIVLTEEYVGRSAELPEKLSAYVEEVIDVKHKPVSYFFYHEGEMPLTLAKKVDIKALRAKGVNRA